MAYRTCLPVRTVVSDGTTHLRPDFAAIIPSCPPATCVTCECDVHTAAAEQDNDWDDEFAPDGTYEPRPGPAPWWTPRTADLLHEILEEKFAAYLEGTHLSGHGTRRGPDRHDFPDFTMGPLLEDLPTIVYPHSGPDWAARFLGCLVDLRLRIEDGLHPVARCQGESVALKIVLDIAADRAGAHNATTDLPAAPGDYDLDAVGKNLVDDWHFLELYGSAFAHFNDYDTFEHPTPGADPIPFWDLPHVWFVPFSSYRTPLAHQQAGFARTPEQAHANCEHGRRLSLGVGAPEMPEMASVAEQLTHQLLHNGYVELVHARAADAAPLRRAVARCAGRARMRFVSTRATFDDGRMFVTMDAPDVPFNSADPYRFELAGSSQQLEPASS